MNIDNLTNKEREILVLINKDKLTFGKLPIQWGKMPRQEVYTHIYGWDNPHVDINLMLTPKEKVILLSNGHDISNELKRDVALLLNVRAARKNPGFCTVQ